MGGKHSAPARHGSPFSVSVSFTEPTVAYTVQAVLITRGDEHCISPFLDCIGGAAREYVIASIVALLPDASSLRAIANVAVTCRAFLAFAYTDSTWWPFLQRHHGCTLPVHGMSSARSQYKTVFTVQSTINLGLERIHHQQQALLREYEQRDCDISTRMFAQVTNECLLQLSSMQAVLLVAIQSGISLAPELASALDDIRFRSYILVTNQYLFLPGSELRTHNLSVSEEVAAAVQERDCVDIGDVLEVVLENMVEVRQEKENTLLVLPNDSYHEAEIKMFSALEKLKNSQTRWFPSL